ncbi:hypothetical protein QAD02_008011, partial [Eretmocerus hayati]
SINPFPADLDRDKLDNISTGKALDDEYSKSLLGILKTRTAMREQFIAECSADPTRFERVITRNQYKTFESVLPQPVNKVVTKAKGLKEQCDMFGRLLGISLDKDLNMEYVSKFPLTEFPSCFAHPDGTTTKTDKAALAKVILGNASWELPSDIGYTLIDEYFFLHILKDVPIKFGSIAKTILTSSLNFKGNHIVLVFDRYFSPSIKDSEHTLRGTEPLANRKIRGSQQNRAFEWSKELRNVNFKLVLVKFLTREWAKDEYAEILGERKVYINYESCFEFAVVGGKVHRTNMPHLSCPDHEEADTKLVFHACQVPASSRVVIRCSDTDVLIIMLGNMDHLNDDVQVWLDFGTGEARKAINVTDLRNSMGEICNALPGIHAFTGNDHNPCFYGMYRTKPLNMLINLSKTDPTYMKALTALGDDGIPKHLASIIENFTCHLYSMNNRVLPSVNAVRFAMFQRTYKCERVEENFSKIKYEYDSARLPPCEGVFIQHFRRSAYISNLWRHAHRSRPTARDPKDFGWVEQDGKYSMNWFEGPRMPKKILEVLNKKAADEHVLNPETAHENAVNQNTANEHAPNQQRAHENALSQEPARGHATNDMTPDDPALNQEMADKHVEDQNEHHESRIVLVSISNYETVSTTRHYEGIHDFTATYFI